jgi:hypothetical protein
MPNAEGGLGSALVGEKIAIGQINVLVTKLIGEGTSLSLLFIIFCFVLYLFFLRL